MKKYFDCSINEISNKNHNYDSLGPIENDIMKDLEKYSNIYGFERVYDYKKADIFITNTVYPPHIIDWSIKYNIPKIKRMDGIYWKNNLKYKNEILNSSALLSDHVIFISEYSKKTFEYLYNYNINSSVILNNVDNSIFYNKYKYKFGIVSSATNWNREEKRLDSLLYLAKYRNEYLHLIGKCDLKLPPNIIKYGYIENKNKISNILNRSTIFISLFYRDAGSKVTIQALNCGLPVLYTSSGGLNELVKDMGVSIKDNEYLGFGDNIPELNNEDIIFGYDKIKKQYEYYINNINIRPYQDTIKNYFDVMKNYL